MNLPPLDIPALLRQYNLHPDKRLGQNFLVDPSALQKVLHAAEITAQDCVLEIGAGVGNLTRCLASQAEKVIAIELDGNLIPILQYILKDHPNASVVEGDILELNLTEILKNALRGDQNYLVVANIPYYITSAVIRILLAAPYKPQRLVLTVQREVAERICASAGDMSLLALSVQVFGRPRITERIPAGAFYPPPKVDSAIIRVDIYPEPALPAGQLKSFFRLCKAGFSQKRKTLRNSLSGGLAMPPEKVERMLSAAEIDSKRRAETLSLEEWGTLTQIFIQILKQ